MWLRFLAGFSILLFSNSPPVLAAQFRVGPVYTDFPDEVSVVVELPPATTPEARDFRLLLDDRVAAAAQEIKTFRLSGRGLALAVCVDVSGTMSRGPLLDMKDALLSFFAKVRPEDRIALISFADGYTIESSFEEPRDHLDKALRDMQNRGRQTWLYQTLYESLDIFHGGKLPARKRILVISDGKDEGSREHLSTVIEKSKTRGIPIDTVGYGRIKEQYAEMLRILSDATGGHFVHARPDKSALKDALARFYEDILMTRSKVLYFRYEYKEPKRTAHKAYIELQRSGDAPLRVLVPEAIPMNKPGAIWSRVSAYFKTNIFILTGAIIAAVFAVTAAVLARKARHRTQR